MAEAAFDETQGSYWFVNGSSSDGIPNTPIWQTVNGVYCCQFTTNNTDNPGAIIALGTVGSTYNYFFGPNRNSGGRGLCTVDGQESWDVTPTLAFGSQGWIYTLGVPYHCYQ